MKNLWRILILLAIGLVIGIWLYPDSKQTSTTSQFTVVSKVEDHEQLWIQGYNPQAEQKKEIKLLMRDRSAWDDMVENKTYTITYMQTKEQEPVFVELVPMM